MNKFIKIISPIFLIALLSIVSGCTKKTDVRIDDGGLIEGQDEVVQDEPGEEDERAWNTYVNSRLGYKLRYPNNWKCDTPKEIYYYTCKVKDGSFSDGGTIPGIKIRHVNSIVSSTSNPILYLKEISGNKKNGATIPDDYNFLVSGNKAVRIVYKEGNDTFGINDVILILVERNNKLLEIEGHTDINSEYRDDMEKIIKSFEFL